MLPILRILPVGGVLLAIVILVLALSPPDGTRPPLNTTIAPARGALVAREHHPETRQFLIMAALKRADELNRLRDLPDTPTRTELARPEPPQPESNQPEAPKIAGLPGERSDADPDEPTTATEIPSVSIAPEVSEPRTETPAAAKVTPEKPDQAGSREPRRRAHRAYRSRAAARPAQRPVNLFDALFGVHPYPQFGAEQSVQYQPANSGQQYQYQQPLGGGSQQPQPQQPAQPAGDPYLSRPRFY